jgi:BirA family transcriptional regulator, biotin operon repressor / biotin---[acetyl-CoA-carboxylase] ligase
MESPLDDIRMGALTAKWAQSRSYPVSYFPELKSTNSWAKENLENLFTNDLAFHLVVTDFQSKGRGRGTHTWSSPKIGSALLSSWCFSLPQPPQPYLTLRIGLALARAAACTWPYLDWSMKAPNDLFLDGDKVAGLLVESISQGNETKCIVGLGLNVLNTPDDVENAVDLQSVLPEGTPFLAEDWILFLDRFFVELTEAVTRASEPLTTSDQASLLHFLNLNPNLEKQIKKVWPDGSLEIDSRKIPFNEM